VSTVGESGVQLKEGETRLSPAFDAPSATAIVALKTPPRTLTLQEQGFDVSLTYEICVKCFVIFI